ncbi:hypothetical protein CC86DRAFT_451143 [Ophiobolus disseminans]|uniref:F-box domain-containing protein n=1 Tax=Ophiobolus disseminans TaxID=1469910 RepID=A0A6A7AL75_9PLEO|nr:hypothetical protein CC86DRAFT_451143 [Ophiobolus disseminans]
MGNIFTTPKPEESVNSAQSHSDPDDCDGLGTLGCLPRELRNIIYDFALEYAESDAQLVPICGLSFVQAVAVDDLKKKKIDISLWKNIGYQNSITILPSLLSVSVALCCEAMSIALPKYQIIITSGRVAHDLFGFQETVPDNRFACVKDLLLGEMQRFDTIQSLHFQLLERCSTLKHITITISAKQIYRNVSNFLAIMTAPEIVKEYQLTKFLACSTLQRITLKALHIGTIQTGATCDEFVHQKIAFEDLKILLWKECKEAKRDITVEVEWHAGIVCGRG